jgi:hypothetical protein
MPTAAQLKPSTMKPEVCVLVDMRHQAEQRGHTQPLGRLLYLTTDHGTIQFPVVNVVNGEGIGPDLAAYLVPESASAPGVAPVADLNTLIVLGAWMGLPPIRHDSTIACPKCRTDCDSCDGSGKKQCQGYGCGGRGTVDGKWRPCPGENCSAATGKINAAGCDTCHNSGHVAEQNPCPMCNATGKMTCPRCKGTGKIATGYQGGQVPGFSKEKNRMVIPPQCAACNGTTWYEGFAEQEVEKFTNAVLTRDRSVYAVLGPIRSFVISDVVTRHTRIFDVTPDAMGDFMVLLVPATKGLLRKAYLVGGVVREKLAAAGRK